MVGGDCQVWASKDVEAGLVKAISHRETLSFDGAVARLGAVKESRPDQNHFSTGSAAHGGDGRAAAMFLK